jgi:hypothetical protein
MPPFEVPIVFLIFNRPDTTARVFEEIRRIKPVKLLVIADGPRANHPGEAEKCDRVRAVIDWVDWPCDVLKNYADFNMGCKNRVSSGLDWVFEQLEEAIILEDDCVPDQSFFGFCEKLLHYYRDDERIMHIGGANFQNGLTRGDGSYYFSRLNHIWGWATWKRAWKFYDVTMGSYPLFCKQHNIDGILPHKGMRRAWLHNFLLVFTGQLDTWDFQWTYAVWQQSGLSIIPNVNLITNVGFGHDATHTCDSDDPLASIPVARHGELVHPRFVVPDRVADEYTFTATRVAPRQPLVRFLKWFKLLFGGRIHA